MTLNSVILKKTGKVRTT